MMTTSDIRKGYYLQDTLPRPSSINRLFSDFIVHFISRSSNPKDLQDQHGTCMPYETPAVDQGPSSHP